MSIEKPSTPPPIEDPNATKKPPRPLTPEERAEADERMRRIAEERLASEQARIQEIEEIGQAVQAAEEALNKARVPYKPPSNLGFDTSIFLQGSPGPEPESSEQS